MIDQDALFYETIADVRPLQGKLELLWRFAENAGFSDIYYCKLHDPFADAPYHKSNAVEHRFGDEEWHAIYEAANYGRFDWAIERAAWAQTWYRLDEPPADLTGKRLEVVTHAREYNRQNGFCFPLTTSLGLNGGFSATGCDRVIDQAQIMQVVSALQLMEFTLNSEHQTKTRAQYDLTEREMQDLRMLAAGYSMTQIAHITGKTDQWIRLSFSQMRDKLGVVSNPQLVYRAVKLGLL